MKLFSASSFLARRQFLRCAGGSLLLTGVSRGEDEALVNAVSKEQWGQVEDAVNRALEALANKAGGGILGGTVQQPAAAALCVMAFLSRGHLPGSRKYGALLTRSIEAVLDHQATNGLFSKNVTDHPEYHHGIAGLMLCEVYGLTKGPLSERIQAAIINALRVTRTAQLWKKSSPANAGGWRYFSNKADSDLSVTGWHFMFYRSAKNAEFAVPEEWVTEALKFVLACADTTTGGFCYEPGGGAKFTMTAVGLLCLNMAGKRDHPLAAGAAEYLLAHVNETFMWYQYGLYYASQALAQMGGRYWREYYTQLVTKQLMTQKLDGLWEEGSVTPELGTAFAVLSLTPPCQILPIFQR